MDRRHGKSVSGSPRVGAKGTGVFASHRILALAVWLGLALLVGGLTGCATGKAPKEYNTESFMIIVADRAEVQAAWDSYNFHKRQQVYGFCDPMTRTMWVQRGYGGLPDFAVLGHEVWHLEELGGNFHE